MRAASAIVHLALGLVYFAFGNLLWTLASFSFSAGPASLSAVAARMGLLAYAFGVWFMVATVQMLLRSIALLWPAHTRRLVVPELLTPGYRSKSLTELLNSRRMGDRFIPLLTCVIVFSAAGQALPGLPALAWWLLMCLLLAVERKFCQGRAIWHRLPGFFAAILTFAVVLLSWLLFRSATLGQALHYFSALCGRSTLAETASLVDAQMFTDFHVLLLLLAAVFIFVLPPLHRFIEPMARWKQLAGGLVIALVAAFLVIPSFQAQARGWLYTRVGVDNGAVLIGQDGWLFDQRELCALTGSGPLRPEWSAPGAPVSRARAVIEDFARQLKARGVHLLLIPIPMKASIYPEAITRSDEDHSEAPLYQADQPALYEQLMKAGIDVQDITGALLQLKARHKPVFFKQDTHWTPDAMQEIARAVAVHVRKRFPGVVPDDPLIVDTLAPDASGLGDLAQRLSPPPESLFGEEHTVLVSFPGISNAPHSPIALLGDDFASIFDDPRSEFASPEGSHASFAQHLALYLGERIDTTAIHDTTCSRQVTCAITTAREEFAKRLDDEVRAKKLVIWLIPARDLVLPPSAGVEWRDVIFNTRSTPPEVLAPMVSKGR